MAFNHQQYNEQFLQAAQNEGVSISQVQNKYGVEIVEASDVAEGEYYWKAIGVHHLKPLENGSNHHVYLEVLNEKGERVKAPPAWIGWTWEARRPDERADPVPLDKPPNEAGANIAVHFGQIVSVWVKGLSRDAKDKSDVVKNLHTKHPDEPLPDGRLLNTLGHHSFYVVFQRVKKVAPQTISKTEEMMVIEDLPATIKAPGGGAPQNSTISGRVINGAGKTLLLIHKGHIISRRVISEAGFYRFSPLEAGTYTLQIEGSQIKEENIQLDGINTHIANLDLSGTDVSVSRVTTPTIEGKTIAHYLLLGPENKKANLEQALSYILHFGLTVGFSVVEALHASRVTIIGRGVTEAEQQTLSQAGCDVELLTDEAFDIQAELTARIQNGRA